MQQASHLSVQHPSVSAVAVLAHGRFSRDTDRLRSAKLSHASESLQAIKAIFFVVELDIINIAPEW